jgi:hypothetical protein
MIVVKYQKISFAPPSTTLLNGSISLILIIAFISTLLLHLFKLNIRPNSILAYNDNNFYGNLIQVTAIYYNLIFSYATYHKCYLYLLRITIKLCVGFVYDFLIDIQDLALILLINSVKFLT